MENREYLWGTVKDEMDSALIHQDLGLGFSANFLYLLNTFTFLRVHQVAFKIILSLLPVEFPIGKQGISLGNGEG